MFLRSQHKKDRRRRKRQLLNTSVRVFTKHGCLEALGINVSDMGMCLFTLAHLPLDSEVQLELLPPQCSEPVRLRGTVRHRALYLYGVEFLVEADEQPVGWTDLQMTGEPASEATK